jgi:hypothetical protein
MRIYKVALMILCLSFAWANAAPKSEVSHKPQQGAVPIERGTDASPIVVRISNSQPSPEEKQDRDESRRAEVQHAAREESLVSWTKKLANYTLELTVGTFLLATATTALVILGFWQMAEARQSIRASKRAARAAQRSARVAELSLTMLERPWLVRTEFTANLSQFKSPASHKEEWWDLRFNFQNVGRSPAILEKCYVSKCEYDQLPETPNYSEMEGRLVEPRIVAADRTAETHPITFLIKKGDDGRRIAFFGYLTYKDLNGRNHSTGFAGVIDQYEDAAGMITLRRFDLGTTPYEYFD